MREISEEIYRSLSPGGIYLNCRGERTWGPPLLCPEPVYHLRKHCALSLCLPVRLSVSPLRFCYSDSLKAHTAHYLCLCKFSLEGHTPFMPKQGRNAHQILGSWVLRLVFKVGKSCVRNSCQRQSPKARRPLSWRFKSQMWTSALTPWHCRKMTAIFIIILCDWLLKISTTSSISTTAPSNKQTLSNDHTFKISIIFLIVYAVLCQY